MRGWITVLALALLAPTVSAGWGARGFQEPDTTHDRDDGHMFKDPPTGAARAVYFNGFLAQGRGPHVECATSGVLIVNIFVACDPVGGCLETPLFPSTPCYGSTLGLGSSLAGASFQPYPMQPYAILGVWRDCNGDGYIGHGSLGLWEYRSALLVGGGTCPAVTDPPVLPYDDYPSHNDGTWVRELLPIGWNQRGLTDAAGRPRDLNAYDLNDSESRVWADWGEPGAPGRNNCLVAPPPRDTMRRTGGVVEWIDCFSDFRGTATWNAAADLMGRPELGFGDAPRNQSGSSSELNRKNPWGENGDQAFVETCNGEGVPVGNDPLFGWNHTIKAPTPGAVHPDGSLAGQIKETYWHNTWMRCDGGQAPVQRSATELPYSIESDAQNQVGDRVQSDFVFHHYADPRPAPPFAGLHRATPDDFGLRAAAPNGLWRASGDAAFTRPPLVSREALNLAPVTYLTFYAHLGAEAISRYGLAYPGATASYGSKACTTIGTGLPPANGWACDPDAWWPDGTMPRSAKLGGAEVGVRVGKTFHLRDVDCYDNSFQVQREQGLTPGVITGEVCKSA